MKAPSARVILAASLAVLSLVGCGSKEEGYKKKPPYSGKAPAIPAAPNLPPLTKTIEGGWTVAGLIHDFRSQVHHEEVEDKKATIVGYIVKTNLVPCPDKTTLDGNKDQCVPECAVHKKGKEDPQGCKPPVPSFWIGDKPKKEDNAETILVMGWASNFANIYDAIENIDKTDAKKWTDKEFLEKLVDEQYTGVTIPNPLPAVGAKVKVTGQYGSEYKKGTGFAADQIRGILTMDSIEYIEEAPELATLPGMKERKKKDKGK